MSWTAVPRPPLSPRNRFWSSTRFPLSNCWSWSLLKLFSQPSPFNVMGLILPCNGWFPMELALMSPFPILAEASTTSAAINALITLGELGMFDSMFVSVLRARSTGPSLGGASDMVVARRRRQALCSFCLQ